jgi:ATP-dependent helicase/nuclease subunit B
MGRPEVMVTWSKRLEGKPALPSRWVLRLRAVLDVWGLPQDQQLSPDYTSLARRIGKPSRLAPWPRPQARPPVAARPRRFSVTRIEKLVRDSYAIYARDILGLEPLDEVADEPDHSLRGMLIHAALQGWLGEPYEADDRRNEARLLDHGRRVFAPYIQMPEVAQLWWPRFRRMARDLMSIERQLRQNLASTTAEVPGLMKIEAAGIPHDITARADRIDRLNDGSLRIIDYKSGTVPSLKQVKSGFAPQLTLEKLIAETGEFAGMARAPVPEVAYVDVGGKLKAAALMSLDGKDFKLDAVADAHHRELIALLASYQDAGVAYVPRHNLQQEDKPSDFDHLSRRFEWQLAGNAS